MNEKQVSYVNGVAQDFNCKSIEELAELLGYSDSQQMAVDFNCNNTHEMFTAPGFVNRYLTIKYKVEDLQLIR